MKNLSYLMLLLVHTVAYSQQVEILSRGPATDQAQYQRFVYIAEDMEAPPQNLVAKMKVTGELKDVAELYYAVRNEAQKLGANSFSFERFDELDNDEGELTLSVYRNDDEFFDENFEHIPQNKLFIFGSTNLISGKKQEFKIKGNKQEVGPGKYLEYDLPPGEELKVNKGGFTGMTLWFTRSNYGYSHFINFTGIGVNGASVNTAGGVGLSISTRAIHKMEPNLSLLLMRIYSKQ